MTKRDFGLSVSLLSVFDSHSDIEFSDIEIFIFLLQIHFVAEHVKIHLKKNVSNRVEDVSFYYK